MRTTDDFLDVLAGLNEASTVQPALPQRHGSKNFNLSKKLEDTNNNANGYLGKLEKEQFCENEMKLKINFIQNPMKVMTKRTNLICLILSI